MKTKVNQCWKEYWNFTVNAGKGTFLRTITTDLKYNSVIFNIKHRRLQVLIHRFRMGHIGVRSYLHRFHMADDEYCCYCACQGEAEIETIEHMILHCPEHEDNRRILRSKMNNLSVDFCLKALLLGDERYTKLSQSILFYFSNFLRSIQRVHTYF